MILHVRLQHARELPDCIASLCCESLFCDLIRIDSELITRHIEFVADRLLTALGHGKLLARACTSDDAADGNPIQESLQRVFCDLYRIEGAVKNGGKAIHDAVGNLYEPTKEKHDPFSVAPSVRSNT